MKVDYDEKADALYVTLSEARYAYGRDLDDSRRVDFAADDAVIGVEILLPSMGLI